MQYKMETLQASIYTLARTFDKNKLEKIIKGTPLWPEPFNKILSEDFLEYSGIKNWKDWREKYLNLILAHLSKNGLLNSPEHKQYLEELYWVFLKEGGPYSQTNKTQTFIGLFLFMAGSQHRCKLHYYLRNSI